ncbi:hypothetical protein ACFX13_024135 [Malus domestica]
MGTMIMWRNKGKTSEENWFHLHVVLLRHLVNSEDVVGEIIPIEDLTTFVLDEETDLSYLSRQVAPLDILLHLLHIYMSAASSFFTCCLVKTLLN